MKKNLWNYLALSLFTLFAIVVILSCFKFIKVFANNEISDKLGDWSDYSTCLAALFTFVSLTFIYLTYKKQSDSNYKLQFDSTFFNMLHTQREILASFEKGYFIERLERIEMEHSTSWSEEITERQALAIVNGAYIQSKIGYYDNTIMHYFRHLYHIIKLIHNSSFDNEKQREYVDIIQAQMSNEELFVMFYNVISYNNREYIKWLDDYHFFENVKSSGTLFDKIKKIFFKKTVFKYNASTPNNNLLDLDTTKNP